MKKIGFIGLGTMGQPMAANLLKNGYQVAVYNRTSERTQDFVANGIQAYSTPAELTRVSDVIITMLSDDQSVDTVYFGENGIMEGAHPNLTVIDCSTISPSTSIRIHIELVASGVDFLDAPVSGSKPAANDGSLIFMVGGDREVFEAHQSILLTMGSKAIYLGLPGAGSHAKLAANTIVGINVLALCEGFALATKSGIDPEAFLEIVLSGGASSKMAEMKGNKILNRDFSNQFSLQLMFKDLLLANQLADELQLPLSMLQNSKLVYQTAMLKEIGSMDLSSVVLAYEDLMNARIQKKFNPENPETNRRRFTRVKMGIDVKISIHQYNLEGAFEGQTVPGTFYDLSNGGMMVETTTPLAEEMFVVLHFPYDAELPPLIGKIIRVVKVDEGYRYGCLLSGAAIHVRQKLAAYIESRTTNQENA